MMSDTMATKYVAFFSNFCKFSNQFMDSITSRNIRTNFVLICIDSYPNIPAFVDRVPLVYDPTTKQVFVDDEIDKLVERLSVPIDLMSYNSGREGGFCFIEDSGAAVCSSHNFMAINDMDIYKINTPAEDGESAKNKRGGDSSVLERYMAQREEDMRAIKQQVN